MPSTLQYQITDTVNDMVACDQVRQEIETSAIVPSLLPDPNGITCTKTYAFFSFDADLSAPEVLILDGIVAAHTGLGLPSANELEPLPVTDLPVTGNSGNTFFATDGNEGPGPVWFDGTDWRWYGSGGIVSP